MLSRLSSWASAVRRRAPLPVLRSGRSRPFDPSELGRRLVYFWVVWSALLLVHEAGHALAAWRQGIAARRLTIGVGPALWRGQLGGTEAVLRLVPVAGVTTLATPTSSERERADAPSWSAWARQLGTLAGGVLATLTMAVGVAVAVLARERVSGKRWTLGRFVVADAVVLTLFNFLPVPPLDGGRAVVGAFAAWRGAPLSSDALFWVQVGGLALAVVPMTLWTRWTARIDSAAMRWAAPRAAGCTS